jgi:transcriptional regulator NrdR family protein
MRCPECGQNDTSVKDTQSRSNIKEHHSMDLVRLMGSMNAIARRRLCNRCGYLFTTLELPVDVLSYAVCHCGMPAKRGSQYCRQHLSAGAAGQ